MNNELKQKLELGINLPLKAPFIFRLFGKKQIIFTVTDVTTNTGIELGKIYLKIPRNIDGKIDETIEALNNSAMDIAKMAAFTIMDNNFYGFNWLLRYPFALWLKNNAPLDKLWLVSTLVLLSGVENFMDLLRMCETSLLKPYNQK